MPSDFDKALEEAQAQGDAAAQALRDKEREEQRKQHLARSIAEPYLRELAIDVRQKLRELNVPLEERAVGESRWFKRKRRFWDLGSSLFLTEDGYFVADWRLSSAEGFEALVGEIIMESSRGLWQSGIFVDDQSRSLIIIKKVPFEDETILPLADWIAQRVIALGGKASH